MSEEDPRDERRIGSYEPLDTLGEGSQGKVLRARCVSHTQPNVAYGTIVALKMLPFSGSNPSDRERVLRNLDRLRSLEHNGIIRNYESFVWHGEWDDYACAARELLEGETLHDRLAREPHGLPWREVRSIFEPCLEALAFAHDAGVVHRDIKPSNIFITSDGRIKLIDFDVARHEDASTTVSSGAWRGSFDYMAPDFAKLGEFRGDAISDVFSTGVCLYRAITGLLPYPRFDSAAHIAYLRRWRGEDGFTPSFEPNAFRVFTRSAADMLTRSLEPDRARRFQSAHEMLDAFRQIQPKEIRGKDTYVLDGFLGKGGFGEVHSALRHRDGRKLAVKRLFSDRQPRRFLKEARLLSEFRHDHIVEYVDFVDTQDPPGQHHYFLVTEFLEGMPGFSLKTRISRSHDGLDTAEACELFSHYLESLEYLHARDIIHRDIKPANLYAPIGDPAGGKVFDLGVARDISGTVTTGHIPGTLNYMPPEFFTADGGRGTPETDIYSLGLAFYEALTGRPAFPRLSWDDKNAIGEILKRGRPGGTDSINFAIYPFTVFPELAGTLRVALAPAPESRYHKASTMRQEVQATLERIRSKRGRTAPDTDSTRADITMPTAAVPLSLIKPPQPERKATVLQIDQASVPDIKTREGEDGIPVLPRTRAMPFRSLVIGIAAAAFIVVVGIAVLTKMSAQRDRPDLDADTVPAGNESHALEIRMSEIPESPAPVLAPSIPTPPLVIEPVQPELKEAPAEPPVIAVSTTAPKTSPTPHTRDAKATQVEAPPAALVPDVQVPQTEPLELSEDPNRTTLRRIEDAWLAEPKQIDVLDAAFMNQSPVFRLPADEARFTSIRSEWLKLKRTLLAERIADAETAISDFVRYRYQVGNPAAGSYRRTTEPLPPLSIVLPTDADLSFFRVKLSDARRKRLELWANFNAGPGYENRLKSLARDLKAHGDSVRTRPADVSNQCLFESALLEKSPARVIRQFSDSARPPEFFACRAHTAYTPNASCLDTLQDAVAFVEAGGQPDMYDIQLVLFASCYTWRNAVAGEYAYAQKANTLLGAFFARLDSTDNDVVMSILAAGALNRDSDQSDWMPCTYMMEALSLMPGLAHGSNLKQRVEQWLDEYRSRRPVSDRLAELSEPLNLLRALLEKKR